MCDDLIVIIIILLNDEIHGVPYPCSLGAEVETESQGFLLYLLSLCH